MKTLVETCFILDTKLLKKDLKRAREQVTGIEGVINISFGQIQTVADYSFEYTPENDYLIIRYGESEQRIKLAVSQLKFGNRSWYICECGARVAKLYLPPGAKEFKCRHCYNLVYELTTFTRGSKLGAWGYQTNRRIKLMNTREKMRSYLYDDLPTARFMRFLKLSMKAGMANNVEDAKKLLLAIHSM